MLKVLDSVFHTLHKYLMAIGVDVLLLLFILFGTYPAWLAGLALGIMIYTTIFLLFPSLHDYLYGEHADDVSD